METTFIGTRRAWLCTLLGLVACGACGGNSSMSAAPTPATAPVAHVAGTEPSASALMVCADEGQRDIATSIGAAPTQPVVGRWSDAVYACDYVYSHGNVITLSVKELRNGAQTGAYFDELGIRLGRLRALQGLGQGAYQTPGGATVVRKDDLVLLVDVTRLSAQFGVPSSPRADVSLTIAATIMGCWTGE